MTALKNENPPSLSGFGRLLLAILYLVPKNAISRVAGSFASLRLPSALQKIEIQLFARLAGADIAEASNPIEDYDSLQRFFTRALCPGARPVEGDERCVVAPCDGAWGESGIIESGTLVQVKGRPYRVGDLLGDDALRSDYEGGSFATFYLSPRDYHRFHTPVAGEFRRIEHHPGALWPVNAIGLRGIDRLFARNERICAYLTPKRASSTPVAGGESAIALVAVGATMVGSVRLKFDDLTTNDGSSRPERRDFEAGTQKFERGEEWGHFEFGSTIVMLTPPGFCRLDLQPVGEPVSLGRIIGEVCDADEGEGGGERLAPS